MFQDISTNTRNCRCTRSSILCKSYYTKCDEQLIALVTIPGLHNINVCTRMCCFSVRPAEKYNLRCGWRGAFIYVADTQTRRVLCLQARPMTTSAGNDVRVYTRTRKNTFPRSLSVVCEEKSFPREFWGIDARVGSAHDENKCCILWH